MSSTIILIKSLCSSLPSIHNAGCIGMVYLLLFLFEIIQFSPLKPTKWTMIFNSILHCSDWLWPWPSHHITSPLTAIYIQKWNSSMFLQKSLGHWRTTVHDLKQDGKELAGELTSGNINQMCVTNWKHIFKVVELRKTWTWPWTKRLSWTYYYCKLIHKARVTDLKKKPAKWCTCDLVAWKTFMFHNH